MKILRKVISFVLMTMMISSVCVSVSALNAEDDISEFVSASKITVNRTIKDRCFDKNDVNYYEFSLAVDGYISVEAERNEKSDGCIYIDIVNEEGYLIQKIRFSCEKKISNSLNIGLRAGKYFLVYNSHSTAYGEYEFIINYTESEYYESENNGELSAAKKIFENDTYFAAFNSINDIDIYEINLAESGKYDVTISAPETNNIINVLFYDGNGNRTESNSYANGKVCAFLNAGMNFIEISVNNAQNLYHEEYSFRVTKENIAVDNESVMDNYAVEVATAPEKIGTEETKEQPVEIKSVSFEKSESPLKGNEEALTINNIIVYIYNECFKYIVVNDEVIIVEYTGIDSEVQIPDEIRNMPVAGIGANAFRSGVAKKITVPGSVYYINENAFADAGDIVIFCPRNSVAEEFAMENGISYFYADENEIRELAVKYTYHDESEGMEYADGFLKYLPYIIIAALALMVASVCGIIYAVKSKKENYSEKE